MNNYKQCQNCNHKFKEGKKYIYCNSESMEKKLTISELKIDGTHCAAQQQIYVDINAKLDDPNYPSLNKKKKLKCLKWYKNLFYEIGYFDDPNFDNVICRRNKFNGKFQVLYQNLILDWGWGDYCNNFIKTQNLEFKTFCTCKHPNEDSKSSICDKCNKELIKYWI